MLYLGALIWIYARKITTMRIDLELVHSILYGNDRLRWDEATQKSIADSYNFLKHFATDKIIYGINTGFGPMAQWRVDEAHLRELQSGRMASGQRGNGRMRTKTY